MTAEELLAQALLERSRSELASSPTYGIGTQLLQTPFDTSSLGTGESILFNLARGLAGGGLREYGTQVNRRDSDRLAAQLLGQSDSPLSERVIGTDLSEYAAPLLMAERNEARAAEAAIAKRQQALQDSFLRQGLLFDPETQSVSQLPGMQAIAQAEEDAAVSRARRIKEAQIQASGIAQALAASPEQGGGASVTAREIEARVPKTLQDDAFKELKGERTLENFVNHGAEIYERLKEIGTLEAGAPFTAAGATLETFNANLLNTAGDAVKGNPSEKEFQKQMEPYMVKSYDSKKRIDAKKEGFINFLKQGYESTPLLDEYGISGRATGAPQRTEAPREDPLGIR